VCVPANAVKGEFFRQVVTSADDGGLLLCANPFQYRMVMGLDPSIKVEPHFVVSVNNAC
jgi:hypothetical protein